MIYNRFFICFFIVCAVSSCNQQREHEGTAASTIEIPVELKGPAQPTGISLYDMFEKPQVIQVNPEEPISYIYELKYVRGRYYLTDFYRKGIIVFDDSGQVLLKLFKKGRADYEYLSMECFDVNPANGEINIYDINRRRIVVYSESGEFLRSIPLGEHVRIFNDFAVKEDGSFLVYIAFGPAEEPRGLVAVDAEGTFSETLAPLDGDFRHTLVYVPYQNFHRLSDGTVTVRGEQDKNEIYHVSPDGLLTIPFHLCFDVIWSKELRATERPSMGSDSDYYNVPEYFETDHWLGVKVRYQEKYSIFFYNKDTGRLYSGRSSEKGTLKGLIEKGEHDPVFTGYSAGDRLMHVYNPSNSDPSIEDNTIFVKVYKEKCVSPAG